MQTIPGDPIPPMATRGSGWSISNGQLIVEWANEHDQSALAKFIKICKCRATNESNKKYSACTCGWLNFVCLEQCKICSK